MDARGVTCMSEFGGLDDRTTMKWVMNSLDLCDYLRWKIPVPPHLQCVAILYSLTCEILAYKCSQLYSTNV